MPVIKATKTMLAIERALRADQGAKFRSLLKNNIMQCDDAFRGEEDSYRSHMGASGIGRDCPRQIWYDFRWAKITKHVGKTILLFNRGHLEEARFVSLLQMIGMTVWQVDGKGKQFRISHYGGHFGSAIDGVAKGCPDMPDEPINCEFKTSNTKGFKELEKNGCREAKPIHFIQQQVYMGKYKLNWSLYGVVCKETDELYFELIPFEAEVYERYIERPVRIIECDTPPQGIANTPGAWGCKFCEHKDICHNGEEVLKNCRTCRYSQPLPDGTWHCRNYDLTLTKPMQKWEQKQCQGYEVIPGMTQC